LKVVLSRRALLDIEVITLSLADFDLGYALRFEKGLRAFIDQLDLFPHRYPALEADPRLRKAGFGKVAVIYSVLESQQVVWVERVMR
jgi:plasmid stabilization system protein ParE